MNQKKIKINTCLIKQFSTSSNEVVLSLFVDLIIVTNCVLEKLHNNFNSIIPLCKLSRMLSNNFLLIQLKSLLQLVTTSKSCIKLYLRLSRHVFVAAATS